MISTLRREFEHAWATTARAYAFSVAPKTLQRMKEAGWNLYLQGRTDEMARQLERDRHDTPTH